MNTDDPRFDAALRGLHAQAVSRLSAGTTAELHRRRHAALDTATRPRRLFGWPAAAAFASVLGVALALGFGLQRDPPVPAATPLAATPVDADADEAYTALDENPDFYLWLASSDATLLAME